MAFQLSGSAAPGPSGADRGAADQIPASDKPPSWPKLLRALLGRHDLATADTAWAMDEIMAGNATAAQLAGFAVLLRAKGETSTELSGLVDTMLARATPLRVDGNAVDIVGTGGDGARTVNVSTMAALVVAGSGRRVVKHGNRAASSSCGTADVLEELGIRIEAPPELVARCVAEVGIGFCFARVFHPGMRYAGPVRAELGVPTVFNVLGPLANPARVRAGAIGCADPAMAPAMAGVLAARGDAALVFRGDDGLDELTTATTSRVWLAVGGQVQETLVDPAALDLPLAEPGALAGADAAYNAQVVREVLGGDRGAVRDAVLLNAAAGIVAYDALSAEDGPGGADGAVAALTPESLPAALRRGLRLASESIDSGAAADVLARWVRVGGAGEPGRG